MGTTILNLTPNPNEILDINEISLYLTFSTPMNVDDNLRNPANYRFDGYKYDSTTDGYSSGAYARKVEMISSNMVRLWVELLYWQDSFTLTVDRSIKNADGYNLDYDSYNYFPSTPEVIPTFTNYNGMVRTWHESTFVDNDSQRVYLSGTKGIDVFNKVSSTSFSKWAQIFDFYGIDAMYVANYPSALEISDTTPPVLVDPVPSPSSFASYDTRIAFTVSDATTAVEITTLRVYINGVIAFSGGYGGWSNGWSGSIEVDHNQLSVEMWQSSTFRTGSTVTMRIIARDVFGNELDTTYSFRILIPMDGFGGTPFGTSPFGG